MTNLAVDDDTEADLKIVDSATVILARDYKGLGNQPSNAVIEIYEVYDDERVNL